MATILEQYRKRQNEIREQIAANSLPLDQMLIMQELNYRICVLETFESLCKSAPVTMDTKAMGFHFQLVDAYVRFTLNERKFGPKTDAEGQKKRETALQSFTQVVAEISCDLTQRIRIYSKFFDDAVKPIVVECHDVLSPFSYIYPMILYSQAQLRPNVSKTSYSCSSAMPSR